MSILSGRGDRRQRRAQKETSEPLTEAGEGTAIPDPEPDGLEGYGPKEAPADRAENGPFDISEQVGTQPYVDLGALKIPPRQDLVLKVQVQEEAQRIMAVSLEFEGIELMLQPYATPKSSGLWGEAREQLRENLTEQGATIEEVEGPLGTELKARAPHDGEVSQIRFLGADGPRWFLRGVVTGIDFDDTDRNALAEELFRQVVVDRGSEPMAPRDLIPMHVPVAPEQDA